VKHVACRLDFFACAQKIFNTFRLYHSPNIKEHWRLRLNSEATPRFVSNTFPMSETPQKFVIINRVWSYTDLLVTHPCLLKKQFRGSPTGKKTA